MNKKFYIAPLMALVLASCMVVPTRHGPELVVAPALPLVVELGVEPYYFYQGYYYYYNNNNWSYSNAKSGPWTDLPRDRYPREVRHHGHHDNRRDGGRDPYYR
jgi:hypothetical protein